MACIKSFKDYNKNNMHVSGVSFGKNVIKYDYPIEEAIRSIMPICDEIIVAVGKSEDQSLSLIESIDPEKVKILETEWDEELREGGAVLAVCAKNFVQYMYWGHG